jgi:hypothetical protein
MRPQEGSNGPGMALSCSVEDRDPLGCLRSGDYVASPSSKLYLLVTHYHGAA